MPVQQLSDFPSIERAVRQHVDEWPDHRASVVHFVGGNIDRVVCTCGEKWVPGRHGPTADYGRHGRFLL